MSIAAEESPKENKSNKLKSNKLNSFSCIIVFPMQLEVTFAAVNLKRDVSYFPQQALEFAKVYVTAQPTFTSLELQFYSSYTHSPHFCIFSFLHEALVNA